jgi:hypothetical protein
MLNLYGVPLIVLINQQQTFRNPAVEKVKLRVGSMFQVSNVGMSCSLIGNILYVSSLTPIEI